jgi:hypothetical protein
MVELFEVQEEENVSRLQDKAKHWRIIVRGSWLGTVAYMKDGHLGIRFYEDVVLAPTLLKEIIKVVEILEVRLSDTQTLPMFPIPAGEIGN